MSDSKLHSNILKIQLGEPDKTQDTELRELKKGEEAQQDLAANSDRRRKELADFLRTRRERLKPEQVGLGGGGGRRRTPGLRREEVAELAGVGATWYTWLEQARDIQPSSEVLDRLAKALQLDPTETRHLFALAGKLAPLSLEKNIDSVPESLRLMIERSFRAPAFIINRRWDILAYNKEGEWLLKPTLNQPPDKLNWMYYLFGSKSVRSSLTHWDEHVRRSVAEFRASLIDSLEDPYVTELVDALKRDIPEFNQIWQEHEVRGDSMFEILSSDPRHPNTKFLRTLLHLPDNPFLRVVVVTHLTDEEEQN